MATAIEKLSWTNNYNSSVTSGKGGQLTVSEVAVSFSFFTEL